MKLNALMDNFGARKDVKRVGRGMASGYGKTSGRGNKGQKSRSGSRKQATFQGGQMPILRRFPKFGFNNPFHKEYATINLGDIEKFIASGKIDANKELSQGLSRLMAVAESYPDLKANSNFLSLSTELSQIENDIANSRKFYNGVVRKLNTKIESFPSNLIAGMFKFETQKMFEVANEEERENVKVQF